VAARSRTRRMDRARRITQVVRTAGASGCLICTRARGKTGEHQSRYVSCDLRLLESVVLGRLPNSASVSSMRSPRGSIPPGSRGASGLRLGGAIKARRATPFPLSKHDRRVARAPFWRCEPRPRAVGQKMIVVGYDVTAPARTRSPACDRVRPRLYREGGGPFSVAAAEPRAARSHGKGVPCHPGCT
jgi:hypothetical protein